MKSKKILKTLLVFVLSVLCILSLVACGSSLKGVDNGNNNVLEETDINSEANIEQELEQEQEQIQEELLFNGLPLASGGSVVTEALPTSSIKVDCLSIGRNATSVWTTEFTSNGYVVKAWVEDKLLISNPSKIENSDSVVVVLSQASANIGYYSGITIKVIAMPDGTVKSYKANSSTTLQETNLGVTSKVSFWAKTGTTAIGYKVELTIPYSAVSLTSANAKNKLTAGLFLLNSSSKSFKAYYNSYKLNTFGVDQNNQNTYLVASGNNTFSLNSNPYPTGTFFTRLEEREKTMVNYWDVSKDYVKQDANYANRKVSLNRSNGTRNNHLYFYKDTGTTFYFEGDFKTSSNLVFEGDKYPKFGIKLSNASNKGVYFYISADAPNGTITGTKVGYVLSNGNTYNWSTGQLVDVGFNVNSSLRMGIARNKGIVYLLVNGSVVFTLDNICSFGAEEAITPSLFSFNIGFEVTNYTSTTDISNMEMFKPYPKFSGTVNGSMTALDSSNTKINLDEVGAYDWNVFGGNGATATPSAQKTTTKDYLGSLNTTGQSVGAFNDFLYNTSSITYNGQTKTGNIPGLTIYSQVGVGFKYKLNVYAGEKRDYHLYLGSYSAVVGVNLKDSSGAILYSETYGTVDVARRVVDLKLQIDATIDTTITAEIIVSQEQHDSRQVWILGGAVGNRATSSLVAFSGSASANISTLDRANANINYATLGTLDYQVWGNSSNPTSVVAEKTATNKYLVGISSIKGVALGTFGDFFTGGSVTHTTTVTGNIPGVTAHEKTLGEGIKYTLKTYSGKTVIYSIMLGSWDTSANINVYDANGAKIVNTTLTNAAYTVSKYELTIASNVNTEVYVNITITDQTVAYPQVWLQGAYVSEDEFNGKVYGGFDIIDSSQENVNFDSLGTLDWRVYGADTPTTPLAKKSTSKAYLGDISSVYGTASLNKLNDFMHTNGSATYNSKTVNAPVPGVRMVTGNGGSARDGIKQTFKAYAGERTTYGFIAGTFLGSFDVVVKNSKGELIYRDYILNKDARTIGYINLTVYTSTNCTLTIEITHVGDANDANAQIWYFGSYACSNAFAGTVSASQTSLDRANANINLDTLGSLDAEVYSWGDSIVDENKIFASFSKNGGYLGSMKSISGENLGNVGDFFLTNATLTYNGVVHTAPIAGIQKQAIGREDGIAYSINAKAGQKVRFTFITGAWCSPYTINVKNLAGSVVATTSVADAGTANMAQVSIDVNATASGTLIVEIVAPSTGNVWLCAAAAASIA